jgi:hypothetical protein
MTSASFMDLLFVFPLMAMVPLMVGLYLKSPYFTASTRKIVMVGGILWLGYVFVSEYVSDHWLGVPWWDARFHEYFGMILAEQISRGNWSAYFDYFKTGNSAYHCYSALILCTGATIFTLTAINAFLAFWGGLILASCFSSVCPFPRNSRALLLFIIFCPSVFFWCTVNLKEAIMYWCICNVFSLGFPQRGFGFFTRVPLTVFAVVVGAFLRPHVMVGWLAAVGAVTVLRSGRRFAAIIMLMCFPIVAFSLRNMLKADFSMDVAIQMGETQHRTLASIGMMGSKISGKPIFLVSGIVSAFFRPFPWEIGSGRSLACSVETWTMTILILYAWTTLRGKGKSHAIKLPCVHIAILASLWMCMLLSYFPNEGLMVRQRVQMIPAMLTLVAIPLMLKSIARARIQAVRRQALMRPPYAREPSF